MRPRELVEKLYSKTELWIRANSENIAEKSWIFVLNVFYSSKHKTSSLFVNKRIQVEIFVNYSFDDQIVKYETLVNFRKKKHFEDSAVTAVIRLFLFIDNFSNHYTRVTIVFHV